MDNFAAVCITSRPFFVSFREMWYSFPRVRMKGVLQRSVRLMRIHARMEYVPVLVSRHLLLSEPEVKTSIEVKGDSNNSSYNNNNINKQAKNNGCSCLPGELPGHINTRHDGRDYERTLHGNAAHLVAHGS